MSLIKIDEHAAKEEKLNQILDYMEELKNAFAEVVDEFGSGESKTRYLIQFNDCPLRGVA